MSDQVDLSTWPRAEQFRFFRSFERPHYAITTRINVTNLMMRRAKADISPFRACLWAIGSGLVAVPELRMRFDNDVVTQHLGVTLSPPLAQDDGSFRFGYFKWQSDFSAFDVTAKAEISRVAQESALNPDNAGTADVAYASCLPWLDYTSLDNALPHKDDCVPRVSWGKIVPSAQGHDMAMTLQVHHALVDGAHVGAFFEATQSALTTF